MTLPVKRNPPFNVNVINRWLTEAAREAGVTEGRLRTWLGFMVVAGMLGRALDEDERPIFLVKGGVAMELRLTTGARGTRDLDTAIRADIDQAATLLDTAFEQGFGDFAAQRSELESIRETGALRCRVKVSYKSRSVVTIPMEIAAVEASLGDEFEDVPGLSLAFVGVEGPQTVACIAIRWQIAQKLHACTEVIDGRENDRFRDLVDLQLLARLVEDDEWPAVRQACVEVFDGRGAHRWPPTLTPPDSWIEGYPNLVTEIGIGVPTLDEAIAQVVDLIAKIDGAT